MHNVQRCGLLLSMQRGLCCLPFKYKSLRCVVVFVAKRDRLTDNNLMLTRLESGACQLLWQRSLQLKLQVRIHVSWC